MRVLSTACGAHALHDGFTGTLYVLLPILQIVFGLNYAEVGILRALHAGTMATLQIPSATLSRQFGSVRILAAGTMLAGTGYLCLGMSNGLVMLAFALILGGIGSSTQHPIDSSLIATAYEGSRSRDALGTYNFAGDHGKMALPALGAFLIAASSWRVASAIIGLAGLLGAIAVLLSLHATTPSSADQSEANAKSEMVGEGVRLRHSGFGLLLAIGTIDSATWTGFLTFLPFLLRAKGADVPDIGVALSLLFAGGAAGKLVCGFLGGRLGVLPTVLITEGATAAAIIALLPISLTAAFVLLPVAGIALNGTSSVLCGTVPELVTPNRRENAFSVFYTATIGNGALSPIFYGIVGDTIGLPMTTLAIAAVVLVTPPLAWILHPMLRA